MMAINKLAGSAVTANIAEDGPVETTRFPWDGSAVIGADLVVLEMTTHTLSTQTENMMKICQEAGSAVTAKIAEDALMVNVKDDSAVIVRHPVVLEVTWTVSAPTE